VTVSYAEPVDEMMGSGDPDDNRFFAAPAETCGRLAAALGIDAGDVGYALRTVLLATDIQERGMHTWMCLERLALRGDNANFNRGPDDDWHEEDEERDEEGFTHEESSKLYGALACRRFPFETTVARPHFFEGSRPLESPRKLLPDAKALLEARLNAAATSSICATVKALHGWQAALDATRRTRAVAEARAEHARYRAPQGGSSRRRGAKRSAPPEVPVEELTIRESDCLPYEYEGPPMATMGGGGGCVIA